MARSGLIGPPASLTTGMSFGVPPLLKFGSRQLQERFLPDILLGKKRICIAITEPEAGSDVAGIQTTAEKSSDGKSYIVTGTKKWYSKHQRLSIQMLMIVGSRMESGRHMLQRLFGQAVLDHQVYLSSSCHCWEPLESTCERLVSVGLVAVEPLSSS